MCRSRSDLIENTEHFDRIDLDLSDFEKERNQCQPTLTIHQEWEIDDEQ